jgi:hypothetical protein
MGVKMVRDKATTDQRAERQIFEDQFFDRLKFTFQTRSQTFYSYALTLLDADEQTLVLDSQSHASVSVSNGTNSSLSFANMSGATVGGVIHVQSIAGKSTYHTIKVYHLPFVGTYAFKSFQIISEPDTDLYLMFQSTSMKGTTEMQTQLDSRFHMVDENGYALYLPIKVRACTNGQLYSNLLKE